MWPQIEADFLRDYGIWLKNELEHMSWRTFETLFLGLSPYGAVAHALAAHALESLPAPPPEQLIEFFQQGGASP